jgi:ABC-type nitrate/sulfonate/bicarbonate transport system substrate-binding protein
MRGMKCGLSVALILAAVYPAASQTTLKVNLFTGIQNLPLYAAQEKGFFAKRGIIVEPVRTPNSTVQRESLNNGTVDIVQSAVDNAIDMIDVRKQEVVIVAGGSDGLNELMARSELRTYDDLRGKTMVVDAPDTAYAFVLYKILALKGLRRGDYNVLPVGACAERLAAMKEDPINRSAVLFNAPCDRLLERSGFVSWGRAVDIIGPYQGDGTFVMRAWAAQHSDVLVKYLQALIEGVRWASVPANRSEAVAILMKALKIDEDLAERSFGSAIGPKGGLTSDLKFSEAGFRNTQQVRVDALGGSLDPNIRKYYDGSFYETAINDLR